MDKVSALSEQTEPYSDVQAAAILVQMTCWTSNECLQLLPERASILRNYGIILA